MNRWAALAFLLAVVGALALRLPHLAVRPLHNDEAVNAFKLTALWEKGEYQYDPNEFHGPTLYYFSLPFLGSTHNSAQIGETTLRLATVTFGVALIFLLLLLAEDLGRMATVWAAIFTAVSPAMVFYSRYFIHEMLLVLFTLLTLAAGWRYARTRKVTWAALAGIGLGLMSATKETFVLSVTAMALAAVATVGWNRWRARRTSPLESALQPATHSWKPTRKHAMLAVLTAGVVWTLLFSSFFTNLNGPLDSLRTYLPWLHRAGGNSPHIHPWYFYFERLVWFHQPKGPVWSEGLILVLALVGAIVAFFSNRIIVASPALARFLAFYTLILTTAYTLISYKTPWCLLSFWLGMILLAGIGAAALLQLCRRYFTRLILITVLLMGTFHLGWQAWRASQIYASDRKNPYVYAQTLPDILKLVSRVEAIAAIIPSGHETEVKVIAPDSYWPLPWYLRQFKQIGWWDELPDNPYAPIVIASSKLNAALDEKSSKTYVMTGFFELRPGIFLELYVERELWGKFVATLPRELE